MLAVVVALQDFLPDRFLGACRAARPRFPRPRRPRQSPGAARRPFPRSTHPCCCMNDCFCSEIALSLSASLGSGSGQLALLATLEVQPPGAPSTIFATPCERHTGTGDAPSSPEYCAY